jgi:hypothetical protein
LQIHHAAVDHIRKLGIQLFPDGVVGQVDARFVALGTKTLLDELGIHPDGLAGTAEALRADGETVVLWAEAGRAADAQRQLDGRPAATLLRLHAAGSPGRVGA